MSHRIVYCYCYVRISIQYLVDLKAKKLFTPVFHHIIEPSSLWKMNHSSDGARSGLIEPSPRIPQLCTWLHCVCWSIVMLKEFTSSTNQCQLSKHHILSAVIKISIYSMVIWDKLKVQQRLKIPPNKHVLLFKLPFFDNRF